MNVVAHNIAAMNAQRQFNISANTQKKATEKLSSGYRINRAADDAAGLSISEKMRGQIRGLSQGVENTQAGVSLCQVADGALAEVNDMLHRITELSVKAANGTLSTSDRVAIQEEINEILTEIDRISDTTTFNSQPIFKGDSDQTATSTKVSISLIPSPDYIGSGTINAYNDAGIMCNGRLIPWTSIKDSNGNALANTPIQGGKYTIAVDNNLTIDFQIEDNATREDIVQSINGSSFEIHPNYYTPISIIDDGEDSPITGTMKINAGTKTEDILKNAWKGTSFSANENGVSFCNCTPVSWSSMGIDINNPSGQKGVFSDPESGIEFEFQIAPGMTKSDVILGFEDTKISITPTNMLCDIFHTSVTDNLGNLLSFIITPSLLPPFGRTSGADALGYSNTEALQNGIANLNVTINNDSTISITSERNVSLSLSLHSFSERSAEPGVYELRFGNDNCSLYIFSRGRSGITQDEMLSYLGTLGDLGVTNTSNLPFSIRKKADGQLYKDSTINLQTPHQDTKITFPTTANQFFIQSGCDTMDGMVLRIDQMNTRTLGIEDINLTTIAGADEAMTLAGDALERLNASRTKIGAQQNRLEHTIANEENTVENTTSSESRIRDTDMAEEMVKYSTHNILVQAGQAMMAQANQSTQGVLSLLQ